MDKSAAIDALRRRRARAAETADALEAELDRYPRPQVRARLVRAVAVMNAIDDMLARYEGGSG